MSINVPIYSKAHAHSYSLVAEIDVFIILLFVSFYFINHMINDRYQNGLIKSKSNLILYDIHL